MKTENIKNINQQSVKKVDLSVKESQTNIVTENVSKKKENEKVTLSNNLKSLKLKIENATGFDKEKVENIKSKIENGNYKINYSELANEIIKQEILK